MSSDPEVDHAAVEEYVASVREALSEAPAMSARTAELRVTQPLLELLGWDLHGGSVVAGFRTDAGEVGFALRVDGRPRALVETVAPAEGMGPADGERLLDAMRAAGVARGLLLDGHELAVVRRRGDDRRHHRVDLADLPDSADLLARFTPAALAGDDPAAAARALAADREALAADLTARLLAATDGACEPALRGATETYLDRLIRELGPPEPAAAAAEGSEDAENGADAETTPDGDAAAGATADETLATDESTATDEPSTGDPGSQTGADAPGNTDDPTGEGSAATVDGGSGARSEAGPESGGATADGATTAEATEEGGAGETAEAEQAPARETADGADDGEFVVRFFDGSTKVGAVGGSSPLSALLQAAEHLERQRAVFRGLSTPWSPADLDRAVLTDEPIGDGPTRQLPTGGYLATDLDREAVAATVEGLAGEAGLRVMLQGDW